MFEVYIRELAEAESLTEDGRVALVAAVLDWAGQNPGDARARYESREEPLAALLAEIVQACHDIGYVGYGPHDAPDSPANADQFVFRSSAVAEGFVDALQAAPYRFHACVFVPELTWHEALAILAGTREGDKSAAVQVVHDGILAACETDAGPEGPSSLGDWVSNGTGWEPWLTPEGLAAEWDEYNRLSNE